MDFTFSEEQQAAVEAARAALSDAAPDGGSLPSPAVGGEPIAEDLDRELWQRLCKSDLTGIALAEEYGGGGQSVLAWALVLREAGRVLARVPLLETGAAALAVQHYGSAELRRRVLPEVAAGRLLLSVAPHGRVAHEPAPDGVTAAPAGDGGWTLDGLQTAVPYAPLVDRVLVPARTPGGGVVLLLVDPRGSGVTTRRQVGTHGEVSGELEFAAAPVERAWQLGEPEEDGAADTWRRVRGLLEVGVAALCLGLGEDVLRRTAAYTSQREQFGHPLATFQAVAVQAADRFIDLRAMAATLWQAAWRMDLELRGEAPSGSALPIEADLATAKIWAAEGVRAVTASAQHLHGGMGADLDNPLHRYHAWAKHLELLLGPAAAYEEELGDVLAKDARRG
ncbi:acyl-CoA dehydrogenase family protein [Phaeacidiphilus oryzae]|uniref:acyl-CoA dehydrogenase family protein n=1 Tax=Phaeacidiphilus oryzae TaxID=348818 RepID=UPI00055F7478|nr:acyl-CoA dehydrogenase family protein [Phaeacidiphilus oryzae]